MKKLNDLKPSDFQDYQTFHIDARCINKEWFRVRPEEAWIIFNDYLYFLTCAYHIRIHCFVMMSNHFHLIVSAGSNLPQAMNYFMRETSRIISRSSDRINQVYGRPYHKSYIDSYHYYMHAYKYVYRNPIEAKMAKSILDYKYSTIRGVLGLDRLLIPIEDDLFWDRPDLHLKWLNTGYEDDHLLQIKKALKHGSFQLTRDNSGFKSSLENSLS